MEAAAEPAERPATAVDLLVPSLLAGLAADDDTARSTGRAVAFLAAELPDSVPTLADALAGELAKGEAAPLVRALATLAVADDAAVREALLDAVDTDRAQQLYGLVQAAEPWPRPAPALLEADETEELATAFRRLVRPDREERTVDADRTRHIQRDDGEREDIEPDIDAAAARVEGRPDPVRRREARIERAQNSETFRDIAARSEFSTLEVVAPETERRYASSLRTRAELDGEEYGVAVRLFDRPEDAAIDDALVNRLGAWAKLARVDGVVAVIDHGGSPRPWAVTEFVEARRASRDSLSARETLVHARALTGALAAVHQHDVVHGGIDPRNVTYAADALSETPPMLDNVGLMNVYRKPCDPADYLDPRYAAPEYFDSQYGRLDHATDIYQLGMVLYRAATGHPPFEGTYDDIRMQALNDHPPAPSTVDDGLPEAFDEVVAKATAKQKLTRYETAERFHRDVERVCAAVLD